jgi:hypothetical protein
MNGTIKERSEKSLFFFYFSSSPSSSLLFMLFSTAVQIELEMIHKTYPLVLL